MEIWIQGHLHYLKNHRKVVYVDLLTSGKLNSYLADIDLKEKKVFTSHKNGKAQRCNQTVQTEKSNRVD